MFNRISSALLAALILAAPAALAANFRIADIRIEGLQRVSAGSVFNAVPVNVGDTVTDSGIRQIIREVFKTGSFIDVSVGRDGNVLVISLEERPSIDSINIEGNKAIETEALLEGLMRIQDKIKARKVTRGDTQLPVPHHSGYSALNV